MALVMACSDARSRLSRRSPFPSRGARRGELRARAPVPGRESSSARAPMACCGGGARERSSPDRPATAVRRSPLPTAPGPRHARARRRGAPQGGPQQPWVQDLGSRRPVLRPTRSENGRLGGYAIRGQTGDRGSPADGRPSKAMPVRSSVQVRRVAQPELAQARRLVHARRLVQDPADPQPDAPRRTATAVPPASDQRSSSSRLGPRARSGASRRPPPPRSAGPASPRRAGAP